MASRSSRFTATTTATKVTAGADPFYAGSDVTTANGFPVAAGETLTLSDVTAGDFPFVVVASGTVELAILESRV